MCVPLTSNLAWADAPGNTVLPATVTGLPQTIPVANTSQILALDRRTLAERVRRIGDRQLALLCCAFLHESFDGGARSPPIPRFTAAQPLRAPSGRARVDLYGVLVAGEGFGIAFEGE